MQEAGSPDDDGREPDGEGRVGLEDGWAVGIEVWRRPQQQALRGQKEPELVVAGVGQQSEQR